MQKSNNWVSAPDLEQAKSDGELLEQGRKDFFRQAHQIKQLLRSKEKASSAKSKN